MSFGDGYQEQNGNTRTVSKRIAKGMFLFEAFRWFTFILANIKPTENVEYVSYNRCALIYTVMRGIEIHVGEIINIQLCHAFKKGSPRDGCSLCGLLDYLKRQVCHLVRMKSGYQYFCL